MQLQFAVNLLFPLEARKTKLWTMHFHDSFSGAEATKKYFHVPRFCWRFVGTIKVNVYMRVEAGSFVTKPQTEKRRQRGQQKDIERMSR